MKTATEVTVAIVINVPNGQSGWIDPAEITDLYLPWRITMKKSLTPALITSLVLSALAPLGDARAADSTTSISLGFDYASGDYGTDETTRTYTVPLSIKHEAGPWTLRASLPFVRAEGIFSRDQGAILDDSGQPADNPAVGPASTKRTESGLGDLTVGAYYNLINNPGGYSLDVGGKAKIATADKEKTLITSGENDYSAQIDVFRSLPNVSLFATLGYTIKGDPVGVNYKNPFYSALGLSVPLAAGRSLGAAWDYRQKVVSGGDPINELSAFYSMKFNPNNKLQVYVVHGISDGSPDIGGGLVLTHTY